MRAFIFVAFVLLLAYSARSQQSGNDVAAQTATSTFVQSVRLQKEIYNGPEHIAYLPTIEGFAYLTRKDWQTGTVQYDGIVYRDEQLMYDMVKDRLIVKRPDVFPVEVRSEKTDWFKLPGHFFVYMSGSSYKLRQGFYDQLASGVLTLFSRREKIYEEHAEETKLVQKFRSETFYYAIKNGQSHAIKNLRALLELMDKRGNQIRQQLRKQGIKYKTDHEAALIAAAEAFNTTQP